MSEQATINASEDLINLIFTALANAINTVREVQPFSPLAHGLPLLNDPHQS